MVGGSTLDYTVTLTNGSDHTIALDPCPTYQQALYVVTAPAVPRPEPEFFALNCDTVHAIAPGQSVRYAMRIQIPKVPATTSPTKFVWLMPDGMGVGAGRALTVTDGTTSSAPPSAPASYPPSTGMLTGRALLYGGPATTDGKQTLNGAPDAGTLVTVTNPAGTAVAKTVTGADGVFSFNLPPGTYTIGGCVDTPAKVVAGVTTTQDISCAAP